MDWTYYQMPVRHWLSHFPHGYFIVVEQDDETGEEYYAVYQGDFGEWFGVVGDPSVPQGKYEKLKDAKKFGPDVKP